MKKEYKIEDPKLVKAWFEQVRFAWVWAILRVYLGWQWLTAGWGKVFNPAWTESGTAVKGFWERAVAIPEGGRPVISYDWYRSFLGSMLEGGHYVWMAKLIAWGEVIVGVALIVGLLTGFAAFAGAFMNFNFMLAGTASTNPVLFTVAILLLMAWRVAGYWGVDRWLLPWLGTPWAKPVPLPEPKNA